MTDFVTPEGGPRFALRVPLRPTPHGTIHTRTGTAHSLTKRQWHTHPPNAQTDETPRPPTEAAYIVPMTPNIPTQKTPPATHPIGFGIQQPAKPTIVLPITRRTTDRHQPTTFFK